MPIHPIAFEALFLLDRLATLGKSVHSGPFLLIWKKKLTLCLSGLWIYALLFLRVIRMTAQSQLCPSLMPGGDTHFSAQYNVSSNVPSGGNSTKKMVPNARINGLAFLFQHWLGLSFVHVYVCSCMCRYMWRSQDDLWYGPQKPSNLVFETESLIRLELLEWVRLSGQKCSGICMPSPP